MSDFGSRIAEVKARIGAAISRAGRPAGSVLLVAVSKTHPAKIVAEAACGGLNVFGENRVQEATEKIPIVGQLLGFVESGGEHGGGERQEAARPIASRQGTSPMLRMPVSAPHSESVSPASLSWHLVGHLQSNKAKAAVALFDMIHSVDDAELARRLDRAAGEAGRRQAILLQVSLVGEETKSGVRAEELHPLVDVVAALSNLDLRGLMTIPPYDPDPELSRPLFGALRELGNKVATWVGPGYAGELSMGMTEDFEVAIEEGATIVRVGRALFGERAA